MILEYTDIFEGGKAKKIKAEITTEHSASSYGQPVIVLPDGGTLDAQSWNLMGYRLVSCTKKEAPLMSKWTQNMYAMTGVQTTGGGDR